MKDLRGHKWKLADIDYELPHFGASRVVAEHNRLLDEFAKIHDLLHKANASFVPSTDNACAEIAAALRNSEQFLPLEPAVEQQ